MRARFALAPAFARRRGGGAVEALRRGAELAEMAVDEAGVEVAVAEFVGAAERGQEAGIAARADHDGLVERGRQPVERLVAAFAVRDQLGDHRIVERRDLGARFDAGIDAQAFALRELQRQQLAGRGQKAALGIFGIKPRLDRVAGERHLRLARAAASRRRRCGTAIPPDRGRSRLR